MIKQKSYKTLSYHLEVIEDKASYFSSRGEKSKAFYLKNYSKFVCSTNKSYTNKLEYTLLLLTD